MDKCEIKNSIIIQSNTLHSQIRNLQFRIMYFYQSYPIIIYLIFARTKNNVMPCTLAIIIKTRKCVIRRKNINSEHTLICPWRYLFC